VRTQLIEIFTWLFTRDNGVIDDVIDKFDDYDQDSFVRPPEDVSKFVDTLLDDDTYEIVRAMQHTTEHVSNGIKLPAESIEMWFKFKDVKLKRRKIYRLGDYYLRVMNTGFDKWIFKFYTKQQGVLEGKLVDSFIGAQHPHTSHGNPCFAGMEAPIRASITNYNFTGFAWHIRRFLSSWNYRSPHHQPESFEYTGRLPIHSDSMLKEAFVKNEDGYYPIHKSYWDLERQINIDELLYVNLLLTSGRKKEYKSEPISKLIQHIQNGSKYLNEDIKTLKFTTFNYTATYNLALWLQKKILDCPDINEAFILASYYTNTLHDLYKTNSCTVTGEWHPDYDELQQDINNTLSVQQFIYMDKPKTNERYHDRGYKLINLTRDSDNPNYYQEFSDAVKVLSDMRSKLEMWKNALYSESADYSVIQNRSFSEVNKLIQTDKTVLWDTVTEFIEYVDNIDVTENNDIDNIADLIDNANRDYFVQLDIMQYINKQVKIEYYEKELRRLKKDEKSTVQIANLNL